MWAARSALEAPCGAPRGAALALAASGAIIASSRASYSSRVRWRWSLPLDVLGSMPCRMSTTSSTVTPSVLATAVRTAPTTATFADAR